MPIDRRDYHPKWSLISLLVRKHRAGWVCERCGARHGERDANGVLVQLGVAHLDQDTRNNRFSNLAALCRRCHLNHDRPHTLAKRNFSRRYGRAARKTVGWLFSTDTAGKA